MIDCDLKNNIINSHFSLYVLKIFHLSKFLPFSLILRILYICFFSIYNRISPFNSSSFVLNSKQVVPKLSCPIALFTYYNPILKRGVEEFMITVKEVGVHGKVKVKSHA